MKKVYFAVAAVVLVSIILAIFNHVSNLLKNKEETKKEVASAQVFTQEEKAIELPLEVVKNEEPAFFENKKESRIGESTKIVYETYNDEGNVITTITDIAPYFLYGMSQKDAVQQFEGWNVQSFESDKIVLKRYVKEEVLYKYILGSYGGYVAVFIIKDDGKAELKELTDRAVSSLPDEEQQKLEEGIKIKNDNELIRALEDYES